MKNPSHLLTAFCKIVKLTPVQEVVFGLALVHSSNQEIADSALQFVNQKLPLLIKSYIGEGMQFVNAYNVQTYVILLIFMPNS